MRRWINEKLGFEKPFSMCLIDRIALGIFALIAIYAVASLIRS